MNAQKNESDRLRQQLEATGDNMVQSNEAISARIQEVIEQERKQAAEERQQLLTQIAGLITSQAQLEETRLAGKTALVQKSLLESNKTFQGGMSQFTSGMDVWNTKESELVGKVNSSRDEVKRKLKDDWTSAAEHSTSIQNTTRSVHAETVRVVDEQLADLDTQMRDLDTFVTRARASNAAHHTTHNEAMTSLSSTVENSFSNISAHFTSTFDRVRGLGDEMDTDTKDLEATLDPLGENICRPLSNLREDIRSTVLREYEPTGETPQKLSYEYPTTLPRTQPAEVLLAGMEDEVDNPPTPCKQPPPHLASEATITTTTVPTIFHDNDLDLASAPDRETDGDMLPPLAPAASRCTPTRSTLGSMSLREVNPNVTTGSSVLFDPSASTMSMTVPLAGDEGKARKARRQTGASKRSRTTGGAGDVAGLGVAVDQRENVPPPVTAGGKRKSPRLN
jgi:kinesin family protein 11